MILVSMIVIMVGLVFIYIGRSVKRKGLTDFIAGNNEWFVPKNERKLAERIGAVIILFGVETVLFPVIYLLADGIKGSHFAILAVLHMLIILVLMLADQFSK